MRKNLTAALLVSAMAAMMVTGCASGSGSKETTTAETTAAETTAAETTAAETTAAAKEAGETQYAAPADAVKAAQGDEIHVLDVREWANYAEGRVAGSEWCPIFPLEDESLAEQMTAYAEQHLKDGKEIYIICNSGKRGAEKTTKVLTEAGIDPSLLYTVEGGAKALAEEKSLTTNRTEEAIDWQYVTGKEAVEALGGEEVQFLDVRDMETYAKGHLPQSMNVGLKEIEDPAAQSEMYEMAKAELDPEKPVYILCYSGNKCAKTAISVMKDAGFDTAKLFIIENGAKDADVEAAFVTE